MRKRILSIFQYIIFLGGGLALVWWQLSSMSPEEEKEFRYAFSHANYWLVIPVILMSVASHVSRSMRWKLLMEPLGYKPKLKNVFAVTMIGYLVNSAIPRLGEIVKCTLLARYERLKTDKLVGTILVERTFDFLCYLIFVVFTVLIQLELLGGFAKKQLAKSNEGFPVWAKIVIFAIAVAGVLFLVKYLRKKYPGNKTIIKINSFLKGIGDGFATIKNLKHRRLFLLHTLFIWSMYLLQIYVGFSAMENTSSLGINAACSVLALATLAMILTPGGIGSFPIFVMTTLGLYGIEEPMGVAFGWLIWGVSTGIIVVVGLISLLVLLYVNKNNQHAHNESDTDENILPG